MVSLFVACWISGERQTKGKGSKSGTISPVLQEMGYHNVTWRLGET